MNRFRRRTRVGAESSSSLRTPIGSGSPLRLAMPYFPFRSFRGALDPGRVTYTHLAAIDLLDHANAIRLPTISPTVPVSTDQEVEQNLNRISGVDEGIRTPNNRNHNASVGSGRNVFPLKINSLQGTPAGQRRRKTGKGTA